MDLDASAGSGNYLHRTAASNARLPRTSITMHAQLNGGGPEVRVETGSGNIRVD